ncbi:MAG TPA: hypothetical protein DD416_13760 [Rhodobacteraceae bacterium]|nr:hypothetical protein [Paracoccaceae bacterium]
MSESRGPGSERCFSCAVAGIESLKTKKDKAPLAENSERLEPEQIAEICEKIFSLPVEKVTAPGGKSRVSFRVHFPGKSIIATQRIYPGRMRMEVEVLKRLSELGAPVPKYLGGTEQLFFQEDVGSKRLTSTMRQESAIGQLALAENTFESLLRIHTAAAKADLAAVVPALGENESWVRGLINSSLTVADRYGTDHPQLDMDALTARLTVPATRFIKWDSRPGNGSIGADGQVYWFDWEHCGRRQGMEDFAWLAGDEFWPLGPEVVVPILEYLLPAADKAAELAYLTDFITFHMVQRLQLIHLRFMAAGWVNVADAMKYDKVGVDPQLAKNLCARGAAWADRSTLTRPMTAFFQDCAAAVDGFGRSES